MNNSSPLVILGGARSQGNTFRAIQRLFGDHARFELVDLNQHKIKPYSYDKEPADDFLILINRMMDHEAIVFATPVYWYAMSGPMKIFFDRLTDLITRQKHLGRGLAGKRTFLIATGTDPELPEGFEVPFRRTSEYFSMTYIRSAYFVCKGDAIIQENKDANGFISQVSSASSVAEVGTQ